MTYLYWNFSVSRNSWLFLSPLFLLLPFLVFSCLPFTFVWYRVVFNMIFMFTCPEVNCLVILMVSLYLFWATFFFHILVFSLISRLFYPRNLFSPSCVSVDYFCCLFSPRHLLLYVYVLTLVIFVLDYQSWASRPKSMTRLASRDRAITVETVVKWVSKVFIAKPVTFKSDYNQSNDDIFFYHFRYQTQIYS